MKIYVFETSESGFHVTRSAKLAVEKCGAIKAQGYGLQGNSFGIPVFNRKNETLSLTKMLPYIRKFIQYAKEHPEDQFKVESIGVEAAKFPKEYIAPLFTGYTSNIEFFDEELKALIPQPQCATRLLITSSRTFADLQKIYETNTKLTHFFDIKDIEFVPAIESLAGRLMNGYSKKHQIPSKIFKVLWERLDLPVMTEKTTPKGTINSAAIYDKIAWSLAYSTDLLIFDDYKGKDVNNILKLAQECSFNSILYFGSTEDTQNKQSDGKFPSRVDI